MWLRITLLISCGFSPPVAATGKFLYQADMVGGAPGAFAAGSCSLPAGLAGPS